MAAHVEAVGQQGHGVVEPARGDLHRHHHGGDPQHPAGAALAGGVAGIEDMLMPPGGGVVGVHPRVLTADLHGFCAGRARAGRSGARPLPIGVH
jgi:hypothetical protein